LFSDQTLALLADLASNGTDHVRSQGCAMLAADLIVDDERACTDRLRCARGASTRGAE